MLVCTNCGVLIGAMFKADAGEFAAINAGIVDAGISLGETQTVSPKSLGVGEKTERWKRLWFRNVQVTFAEA